jgi:hypothetical protein
MSSQVKPVQHSPARNARGCFATFRTPANYAGPVEHPDDPGAGTLRGRCAAASPVICLANQAGVMHPTHRRTPGVGRGEIRIFGMGQVRAGY